MADGAQRRAPIAGDGFSGTVQISHRRSRKTVAPGRLLGQSRYKGAQQGENPYAQLRNLRRPFPCRGRHGGGGISALFFFLLGTFQGVGAVIAEEAKVESRAPGVAFFPTSERRIVACENISGGLSRFPGRRCEAIGIPKRTREIHT